MGRVVVITGAAIAEYRWSCGDSDGYSRSARAKSGLISDEQWHLIDELLQRLTTASGRSASEAFLRQLDADLSRLVPDPDARQALVELANGSAESGHSSAAV
jgi:hypothetical protein